MNESEVCLAFLSGEGGKAPQTLLVAAHPDDETVGAGAQLARLRESVRLVHLTDGAPHDMRDAYAAGLPTSEAYAEARRRELHKALALAGVPPESALSFGYRDQEASLHLAEATGRLVEEIERQRPRFVLAPAYEGGHPDHDAAAFVAAAACALVRRARRAGVVHLLEYPLYHAGPGGVRHLEFLPAACVELPLPLAPEQEALKRRMLACFSTQRRVLEPFPCDRERFRCAPAHDFTRAPHEGPLFYESFPWGMDAARFGTLAAAALRELGLAEAVLP